MMITIEDIRAIRQIAGNIQEDRVNIYIREAELLDLEPVIGAELYEKLSNVGQIMVNVGGTEYELMDETGVNGILVCDENELPLNEYKLLNGGYYEDDNGVKHRFEGIRKALAYFAFARFVRNHQAQVTPFGVVTKIGDDSQALDSRGVASISNDAYKIASSYIDDAMRFWAIVTDCRKKSITGANTHRKKFIAVGD